MKKISLILINELPQVNDLRQFCLHICKKRLQKRLFQCKIVITDSYLVASDKLYFLDDSGNEVARSNGFKPDELENLISQL